MIARRPLLVVLILVMLMLAEARGQTPRGAVPVRVSADKAGFQLLRDGKPYVVKGAGIAGDGSLALLAGSGGNSVRTWGVEGLGETLDAAHKLGLTVAVGIWLGHERHGFNYGDPGQVARQREEARRVILRYKDHPAVLLWGLGNEMEGEGTNPAVWSAIEDIAAMARTLDPDHPTMTVLAEVGGPKVKNLHRLCPHVDIVGINSYGSVASVPDRYRAAGGTRPFLLTEFGPAGTWETARDAQGMAAEPSSTAKSAAYRRGYETAAASKSCLGSYAFLWGTKQEGTATWFGMLLPDGSRLAAADTLGELWSGKPPANRCPTIDRMAVDGPATGPTIRVTLAASDPEGDPLTVAWVVRAEVAKPSSGGDREPAPPEFPTAIVASGPAAATVKLPSPGRYRLFAYARDGHGGAAVANVPLFAR